MKRTLTLSPEKQRQIDEITNMFHKIDLDNSGELEVQEMFTLFKTSGLLISKEEIKNLFFSTSSTITLEEFLFRSKDEKYRAKFREVMRKIKRKMKLKRFHGFDERGKDKVDMQIGNHPLFTF